ncbi:hypothetical protein GOP47_0008040 [Adiantum capillus-veneris]|uniref:Uncharacterized protein n=1 Tax=Adiantum capillus-veneris TaxID=13818 RepID=A0A9D4UXG9_ADICA|nr:hypothetical protein GOP47_0008040 [Adiantum capillus-veneris]
MRACHFGETKVEIAAISSGHTLHDFCQERVDGVKGTGQHMAPRVCDVGAARVAHKRCGDGHGRNWHAYKCCNNFNMVLPAAIDSMVCRSHVKGWLHAMSNTSVHHMGRSIVQHEVLRLLVGIK